MSVLGKVAAVTDNHRSNDSEYIRDLSELEQKRNGDSEAICAALIVGESSGEPRSFNVDEFKRRMSSAYG